MEITNGLFDLHNVSPQGNKAAGGLRLYIPLLINMWSVCGQWRRGFACTIKTDATFYLLNGREAERVALDHAAACSCRVMTSSFHTLLRWMNEGGWFGGRCPNETFFLCPSWINGPRGEERGAALDNKLVNSPTGLSCDQTVMDHLWYLE